MIAAPEKRSVACGSGYAEHKCVLTDDQARGAMAPSTRDPVFAELATTQYPKTDRAELVDKEMVSEFMGTLFAGVPGYKPNHFINVRGIGEKGTDREGAFQEDCWAQPGVVMKGEDPDELLAADVTTWASLWAQHNVATYIVPAVLKEARGSSSAVELFTNIVVDLDTGDTGAKATYLAEHLGTPSIVVRSGGVTDAGTPKLHLYWVFDTPCADVGRVVDLRHELAVKIGGDLQFGRGVADNPYGRAHQPIRIPGTVHAKGDTPRLVELAKADPSQLYEIDTLAEALRRMPPSVWAIQTAQSVAGVLGFDCFGPTINHRPDIAHVLDTPVAEGGEDRTRWSEFNRVAGHYLQQVRLGDKTLAEARELVHGWALVNMQPAWPEARIDKEFRALTAVEERKGPLPEMGTAAPPQILVGRQKRVFAFRRIDELIANPKPVAWLIRGMLETDSLAMIFGEPGAGKSFLAIDWAVCIATGTPHVGRKTAAGSVLFIAGEGGNGLGRRFTACAQAKGLSLEGAPLFVSSMASAMTDADSVRELQATVDAHVQQLGAPALIVVDTVARNFGPGDENSTKDMTRFIAACDAIRDQTGACVLLVHHSGHADKTRARGSIALKGALDWEYALIKDSGVLHLLCTKAKDAEPPPPSAFRLTQVDLGEVDDEGESVTSAVLNPAVALQLSQQGSAGRGKNQTQALRVLEEVYQEARDQLERTGRDPDGARVSRKVWRDRCIADGMTAKRFSEASKSLQALGRACVDGDWVTPASGTFHVLPE